ncbi:hypothetical protein [Microbacterium sp. Root61]|uniref:hypothetical protein n=1 Tax=Microbacterium sp. Root61 TaxID=1736570 RepID=UPI0012E376CF|nr:hypothetical protein [Microbacterium sp. Root61]
MRVRRGVLAPAQQWAKLKPWERYVARIHAVVLLRPGVVMCGESAAVVLGLPIFGEPADVHVLDTPTATARLHGGIRVHTTHADRAIVQVGGILATSMIDTVIDVARSRHGAVGLAVADAALRADPDLSVETFVAANESRASIRGRRVARWALHRATALAETPLESVSRAAIEWLGFEDPTLQVAFRTGGALDRSDMWWEKARVIGEADGDIKYDGSLQPSAEAIRKEKDRDRRLRHHASGIGHWGWSDVARVAPLRDALHHAGLRPVAPETSRELLSLSTLLGRRHASGRDRAPDRETATGRRD